jgi:cysteine desulfurase
MSEDVTTYLDHGATTPLRPEVAEAMAQARSMPLGNPTGSHRPAQRARRLLEESRDEVAAVLGREPGDIIFTSGGTESANLAVLGTLGGALAGTAGTAGTAGSDAADARRDVSVVSSAVEHPAVRESCRAAARTLGVRWCEAVVDQNGRVDVESLAAQVDGTTALVAVMLANNETGVVQPLDAVIEAVRAASDTAQVFTDAVQAATFMDLAASTAGADLVALSAHKVGGPVGIGVLALSASTVLVPQHVGGGQERERRSGTQDVAGAVGLATALRLAAAERHAASCRVGALRDRLADGLLATVVDTHRTVVGETAALPGHLHLCFEGIEREELLVALSERGICASGGSSCASGALEPSSVLTAMGVPDALARGALRFTLGHDTSDADIDRALAIVPGVIAALRHGS